MRISLSSQKECLDAQGVGQKIREKIPTELATVQRMLREKADAVEEEVDVSDDAASDSIEDIGGNAI